MIFILLAYLLGSISFALVASWVFNLPDPRTYGSGNPGATNVLRSGKKAAAVMTLLGDAGKGWLAIILVQHYVATWSLGDETIAAVALAVLLGHIFPVFLRFEGGKGVATAVGILLGLLDGCIEGPRVGCAVGWREGCPVGRLNGWRDGWEVGCLLGWLVGC